MEASSRPLKAGKLPPRLLEKLLAEIRPSARVVLGGGLGRDAAVLDFAGAWGPLLVAKTDPITFATDRIGWYAVNVNANDIACMGAIPRWFLATTLLPEGAPESQAVDVFRQIEAACKTLGVDLVGGHTEVTIGLDRPIVVGCMLGEVHRSRLVTPEGARPGDALLLTQGIAIEGTALLARESAASLRRAGVSDAEIEAAAGLLDRPGISVVPAAAALCEAGSVHALHDPTEGGLATAIRELASAANLGAKLWAERIPILTETARVCRALDLDPMGLLASGALLAALDPAAVDHAQILLGSRGIPCSVIGELVPPAAGLTIAGPSRRLELQTFERDELARYLES